MVDQQTSILVMVLNRQGHCAPSPPTSTSLLQLQKLGFELHPNLYLSGPTANAPSNEVKVQVGSGL